MGGKCFVGAREAAEGRRGHVTRVDDVTVRDKVTNLKDLKDGCRYAAYLI